MHSNPVSFLLSLPVELQLKIIQFIDCPLHPSPYPTSLVKPVTGNTLSPGAQARSPKTPAAPLGHHTLGAEALFPRRVYRVPTFRGRAAIEFTIPLPNPPINPLASLRLTCRHFETVLKIYANSLTVDYLSRIPYGLEMFSALAPHLTVHKVNFTNVWSGLPASGYSVNSEASEFSPDPQERKVNLKRMYNASRFAQVIEANWDENDEKNVNAIMNIYYNTLAVQGRITGMERERDELRRILVMSFLGFNFLKTPFTPLASFFGEYFILLSLFLHHVLSYAVTMSTTTRKYEMSELLFTIMSSGSQGVLQCFQELLKGGDGLEVAERKEMEFERTILCNEDLAQFYLTRRIVRKAALQGFEQGRKVGGMGFEEWKYIVRGRDKVGL